MRTILLLVWPALSWGQLSAPPAPPTVTRLHDDFIEAVEADKKAEALSALARTAPSSARDVQSLFDLFLRFADAPARGAALSSLELLDPHAANLDQLFIRYLDDSDPAGELFALRGALRVRSPGALPLIWKIARRRFAFADPQTAALPSERNAWYAQYEALSVLAQWEPEKALPLIVKKTREAPQTARVLGLQLWKDSFAQIVAWASSSKPANRQRGLEALRADAPAAQLRATREEMLKLVRDRKADKEVRHQLALKVGAGSTDEEAGALLLEQAAASDEETGLMLAAAIFASRSRRAIPLLEQYAKENPDPALRAGALAQLKDMLEAPRYRALLDWAAKNDPDADNRRAAQAQLK